MKYNTTKLVSLMGALLVVGCMGAPEPGVAGGHTAGLVEVGADTDPLTSVSSDAWRRAPRDCHGRLPADVSFELVREGFVVAIDGLGNPLCVDTVENVQRELEGDGRLSEASDLEDAYLLAIGLAIPGTDIDTGDPSPQPSSEAMDTSPADPADTADIDEGDPSPQPSTQPMAPDET